MRADEPRYSELAERPDQAVFAGSVQGCWAPTAASASPASVGITEGRQYRLVEHPGQHGGSRMVRSVRGRDVDVELVTSVHST